MATEAIDHPCRCLCLCSGTGVEGGGVEGGIPRGGGGCVV
jgi:hypothetical protein